jgi:hypothetical protein
MTDNFEKRAAAVGIVAASWPFGPAVGHEPRTDEPCPRCEVVAWAEWRHLRYCETGTCLHWLARGRCGVRVCLENATNYRWMANSTGWTRNGKPHLLVCQPFGLGFEGLREIVAAAERFDLDVQIGGTGWYGYHTTFIELIREGAG